VTRVLITGGSTGIGLAVAQALAERGHELVLVARTAETLEQAWRGLPGAGHEWHAFDVSDETSWQDLRPEGLDDLVCAAAVMAPVGQVGEYEPAAFRRTLDVNLVGTLLAIHYCVSTLEERRGSIVTFGGGGATLPLPRFDAYAAYKAAVARLTENLASTLTIPINCIAPGFVATDIHRAALAAGPSMTGSSYYENTKRQLASGGVPASEAAELVCLLLEGVKFTGKVVSAQWDPWRDAEFHRRLESDRDFATVRRIDGMLFDAKDGADQSP
jgi:NAD(P)-dependent dehydrogenase (short-subunit alcohol dehydrogenase family)